MGLGLGLGRETESAAVERGAVCRHASQWVPGGFIRCRFILLLV